MSLNNTPSGERIHIGIFGRRNAGKSSIINALTGQDLAIVSEKKGTTTDPVYKSMELIPLGPVVLIDTPGLDDAGELGELRIKKSYQVLQKTDIALLIIDGAEGITEIDKVLLGTIKRRQIPYLIVYNKSDLSDKKEDTEKYLWVSAKEKLGIRELKEKIAGYFINEQGQRPIVRDLFAPSDFIILVVPIDEAAPKGRLILPQQQVIRDILEGDGAAIVVREYEVEQTLVSLGKKPRIVITDSQVFGEVASVVPDDIPLTSFSILFSRYKGELEEAVRSVVAIEKLEEGDRILIGEGCTHHRQCDDIGTVKVPRWLQEYTGKNLLFDFTSGREFPEDLSPYRFVAHCGGCTLNTKEMKYRIACGKDQNVPFTNYGILIAYLKGILKRSVELFPEISKHV